MTGTPRIGFSGGSRVAFFGGSFDPPHRGHIAVARAARAALALDQVLFAPVGAQPLKPKGSTASFEDRVAMTRLAIAEEHGPEESGFAISLVDAPAGKPNYTIDTLHTLHAQQPAAQLFCLLGADSFLALRRWHRGAEIPFAAPLIVAARPGQPLDNLNSLLPAGLTLDLTLDLTLNPTLDAEPAPIPAPAGIDLRQATLRNTAGATAPFYLLPGLDVPISASEIRRQMRATGPSADLAPAVRDYIARHHLYQ